MTAQVRPAQRLDSVMNRCICGQPFNMGVLTESGPHQIWCPALKPHSFQSIATNPPTNGDGGPSSNVPVSGEGPTSWLPEDQYEVVRRWHLEYLKRRAADVPMTVEDIRFMWAWGDLLKLSCETQRDCADEREGDWTR